MSDPKTPLEAWQALSDGLAGMVQAEEHMDSDPDGYFDPDFDECATLAMEGYQALLTYPAVLGEIIAGLSALEPLSGKPGRVVHD